MLIPQFWAESRARHRSRNRQITVRRFGWSDVCAEDAQVMADDRVREALDRLVAGEKLARREPKVPYNGAEGVPIREEIVQRLGPDIVTRNSYGALCLNTPDVLFVDVDSPDGPPLALFLVWFASAFAVTAGLMAVLGPDPWTLIGIVMFVIGVPVCRMIHAARMRIVGGPEGLMRRRVESFLESRPDWSLRLYRTPAGFRILAMHRTFAPDEPEVAEAFRELGADPQYARMCLNQKCFRARISPKPWRIGVGDHIKPRRGVWPIPAEALAAREEWIARYEEKSRGFAACRFLETLGSLVSASRTSAVCRLHDEAANAVGDLPIA
jgi:hypothetical protein